jgi:phosphoserine aminotransferase
VLFLQGGASHQFAMVPLNLYQQGKPVDVINTDVWTQKAIGELKVFASHQVAGSTEGEKFSRLPSKNEIKLNPNASYVHICSNNTIAGTQYKSFPETGAVPLVADMSSDILSRRVDVARFGLIFAGAQKNIGPAGLALVIVDKKLAERCPKTVPIFFQYRTHIAEGSRYNTPPTFGIYMVGLVADWLQQQGGLAAMEKLNQTKAKILYDAIDATDFYFCPVKKEDRSLMNVVFRIQKGDEKLEAKFVAEAEAAGLSGLKGHRLVGGLRASIYNAQPMAGVQALVDFMREFEKKNG